MCMGYTDAGFAKLWVIKMPGAAVLIVRPLYHVPPPQTRALSFFLMFFSEGPEKMGCVEILADFCPRRPG